MAFGMESSNPFMIQRLRRQYEGEGYPMDEVPRPEVPDIAPETMPGLQKPVTQSTPRMSEAEKYFQAMQDIRGNQPASAAYKAALADSPDPALYQPSKWRRLAAAVAGGAMGATGQAGLGVEAASSINRAPYEGAVEQWQARAKPAGIAAQMESSDMKAQMDALQNAYSMGLDYDKYREGVRHNMAGERTAGRVAATGERRAAAYEQYVNNPDYEKIDTPNGVMFQNVKDKNDRFTVQGETVASMNAKTSKYTAETGRGMLGVAQTNAATNQTNAATNQKRADIADNAQRSDAGVNFERINDMRDRRRMTQQGIDIRQQGAYRQSLDTAMQEMASDPEYSDHIILDDNTNTYVIDPDTDQETYDDLMEAAELRIDRSSQSPRINAPRSPRNYTSPFSD